MLQEDTINPKNVQNPAAIISFGTGAYLMYSSDVVNVSPTNHWTGYCQSFQGDGFESNFGEHYISSNIMVNMFFGMIIGRSLKLGLNWVIDKNTTFEVVQTPGAPK